MCNIVTPAITLLVALLTSSLICTSYIIADMQLMDSTMLLYAQAGCFCLRTFALYVPQFMPDIHRAHLV